MDLRRMRKVRRRNPEVSFFLFFASCFFFCTYVKTLVLETGHLVYKFKLVEVSGI